MVPNVKVQRRVRMEDRFDIAHEFESGIQEKRHSSQTVSSVNTLHSMPMVTAIA